MFKATLKIHQIHPKFTGPTWASVASQAFNWLNNHNFVDKITIEDHIADWPHKTLNQNASGRTATISTHAVSWFLEKEARESTILWLISIGIDEHYDALEPGTSPRVESGAICRRYSAPPNWWPKLPNFQKK